MLFDLRGSGRRRAVKIVYVTLALLMGGGLVLFGIGGGGALSGGLLDAITESNNSGGGGSDRYVKTEAAATAKARANPQDAALWAAVARARFNLASTGYDQNTGQYSAEGQQQLRNAARAWQEHLKLAKKQPDDRVASLMVQAYISLNDAAGAADAQEVVAESRNSAGTYAQLAQLAYAAGQTRKGDLARDKALELTDPDMRETLKGQLADARNQALGSAAATATPTPTATPADK
jgi:hypothetical protein